MAEEVLEYKIHRFIDVENKTVLAFSRATGTFYLKCPHCGLIQGNFKKDYTVDVNIEMDRYLTFSCPKCHVWIEYFGELKYQ